MCLAGTLSGRTLCTWEEKKFWCNTKLHTSWDFHCNCPIRNITFSCRDSRKNTQKQHILQRAKTPKKTSREKKKHLSETLTTMSTSATWSNIIGTKFTKSNINGIFENWFVSATVIHDFYDFARNLGYSKDAVQHLEHLDLDYFWNSVISWNTIYVLKNGH